MGERGTGLVGRSSRAVTSPLDAHDSGRPSFVPFGLPPADRTPVATLFVSAKWGNKDPWQAWATWGAAAAHAHDAVHSAMETRLWTLFLAVVVSLLWLPLAVAALLPKSETTVSPI